MKESEINTIKLKKLIEKYLKGDITSIELQQLMNYYESFQQVDSWTTEMGSEKELENKMLITILESLENESEAKSVPFYRKGFFKYAVAACFAVCIGINFFYYYQNDTSHVSQNTSNIQKGTDKATLTFADGTRVILENGKEYNSDAVYSNGTHLVYKNKENKDKLKCSYHYLSVPKGGKFFIELADGTEVWLNSDSKISYPENFIEGKKRVVDLIYGEAYFKVSPSSAHQGARFVVKTGDQEIEVLGTEFNVKAYKEEQHIYTSLVEGSIQLKHATNHIEKLTPGEQAIFNKESNDVIVSPIDLSYEIAWKKGLFKFKNADLEEIMTVLSRWYNIDVSFDNEALKQIQFTGQLRKDQDLKSILDLFENTNFIKTYKLENNHVQLK
ncbi:FecR family protein [Zunongwangia sp. HRR-M8]|uniref:FecR family protein n=1 Tax=Zunongwangia sp. HRR-M8 TaxID=3015170 RepID=UPI0022DE89BC|nr:FecR domain-containing protein [Zunongwangia sp. HRR-M8]WBL21486.1 DUF4974 domain-containing protein [Zunongwangia sp. HRR-M8]